MFEFKSAAVKSVFEVAGLSQEIFEDTGLVSKLVQCIYTASSNLDYTDKSLSDAALVVERIAVKVREYVEQGQGLNSLGELQSSGVELDRLCAVRDAQVAALKMLLVAYKGVTNVE